MAKKYTKDKVLYLASRKSGLNMSVDEDEYTDLHQVIDELVNEGLIALYAQDDSDLYYLTTEEGQKQYKNSRPEYFRNKIMQHTELIGSDPIERNTISPSGPDFEKNYKDWVMELEKLLLESANTPMDPREIKFHIVELDKKYGSGSKKHVWDNTVINNIGK